MTLHFLYLEFSKSSRGVHLSPQLLHRNPPNAGRQHVVLVRLQETQWRWEIEAVTSIEPVATAPSIGCVRAEQLCWNSRLLGVKGLESKPLSELLGDFAIVGVVETGILDSNLSFKGGFFGPSHEIALARLRARLFCCWLWRIALQHSALQRSSMIIVSRYWSANENRPGNSESKVKRSELLMEGCSWVIWLGGFILLSAVSQWMDYQPCPNEFWAKDWHFALRLNSSEK